jgi:hypothetical protein
MTQDLSDDAGALRDEPLAHPMQRLQIQLISRLRHYELHCWPHIGEPTASPCLSPGEQLALQIRDLPVLTSRVVCAREISREGPS